MMDVLPSDIVNVESHTGVIGKSLKKLSEQIHIKITYPGAIKLDIELKSRAPTEIDHNPREGFIERDISMTKSPDTFFITHSLIYSLPQRDSNIFNGMMGIDIKIAVGRYIKIHQSVARNLVEHMLKEWYSCLQLRFAFAVKVY